MTSFFTPSQVRAAIGLIGWSGSDLAEKVGVSKQMISNYLSGKSGMSAQNLEKIAYYIDLEGLTFTPDEGVKRKTLNTKTFRGQTGFIEFMDLVYETARDVGGEFCVSNVDEALFTEHMGQEADDDYSDRMRGIKGNYNFKILIKEGDTNFIASDYAAYKWIPEKEFQSVPFYVFGDNLAFLLFDEDVTVHLINDKKIAQAQRAQFAQSWTHARSPDAASTS